MRDMAKTIVIAGYGPGISHAVAEKFGKAGFSVAVVARNAEKLAAGAKALTAQGLPAAAFPADVTDLTAIRQALQKARAALGPIAVLHWNAAAPIAGDLLTAPPEELLNVLKSTCVGLVAAVQEALPDLRKQPEAAVLVTNGGFGLAIDAVDAYAVQIKQMGLAVGNAAKHKTVRVLAQALAKERIYVGEVMVGSSVKGTPWDHDGKATLTTGAIADKFWELYQARKEHFAQLS